MLILKVLTSNSVLFNPLVFIFFVEKKDKEERGLDGFGQTQSKLCRRVMSSRLQKYGTLELS